MKILMRSAMNPLKPHNASTVVRKDSIGTNTGNMVFPYSLFRIFLTEDTTIDTVDEIASIPSDKINSDYDIVMIPLANAFRKDWIPNLKKLTESIRSIDIPCIIVGVGVQASYEPDFSVIDFDDEVLDFCNAVLEKSETIGVRGEITASYLKRIGVPEDKIEVIGCPSMFMWGTSGIKRMTTPDLDSRSRLSLNFNGTDDRLYRFLDIVKKDHPDYRVIMQEIKELRLLYAGDTVRKEIISPYAIQDNTNTDIQADKVRMYINVPSWINSFNDRDLTVGSRIHGNIVSVLSGTPTLVIPQDSRVRELSEYHAIPSISLGDIEKNDYSLERILEKIDFSMTSKAYKDRYDTYIGFLRRNGLDPQIIDANETFFDKTLKEKKLKAPNGVGSYLHRSKKNQMKQLTDYLDLIDGKLEWYDDQLKNGFKESYVNGRNSWLISKKIVRKNYRKLKLKSLLRR